MDYTISQTFLPSKQNSFIWLNAIFLITLLLIEKADPLTIVLAYFLETIIIGIIQTFKMYSIINYVKKKPSTHPNKINHVIILFFITHYLFFVGVQLIFVFAFLKISDNNIEKAYYLIQNLKYILSFKGITLVLISISIYNLADFLINFRIPKHYKTHTINNISLQPYSRIFIQQFTVILGAFFIIFLSNIMVIAILLILIKTYLELYFVSKNLIN